MEETHWEVRGLVSHQELRKEENFVTPRAGLLYNHINTEMNAKKKKKPQNLIVHSLEQNSPLPATNMMPLGYLRRRAE